MVDKELIARVWNCCERLDKLTVKLRIVLPENFRIIEDDQECFYSLMRKSNHQFIVGYRKVFVLRDHLKRLLYDIKGENLPEVKSIREKVDDIIIEDEPGILKNIVKELECCDMDVSEFHTPTYEERLIEAENQLEEVETYFRQASDDKVIMRIREEIKEEIMEKMSDEWKQKGRCQYCGGKFERRLFGMMGKCSQCGKKRLQP